MKGKVIHHWSTTAANWISPPPINMQKQLSQGKQEGGRAGGRERKTEGQRERQRERETEMGTC